MLAQKEELAAICQVIEESGADERVEKLELPGELVKWDTVHRTFIMQFPKGESISGVVSESIDMSQPRPVPSRYTANLLKQITVPYVSGRQQISWTLEDLSGAQ
jgi:hypothetical protein